MASFHDWVPPYGNYKRLNSIKYNTDAILGDSYVVADYRIDDSEIDEEWFYPMDESAVDVNRMLLLPSKCFELKLELSGGEPTNWNGIDSGNTYWLISIGSGEWISGFEEAHRLGVTGDEAFQWRSRSRWSNESFRALVQTCVSIQSGKDALTGYTVKEFGYTYVNHFLIVKFDSTLAFQELVDSGKFPYVSSEGLQPDLYNRLFKFNRIVARIAEVDVPDDVYMRTQHLYKWADKESWILDPGSYNDYTLWFTIPEISINRTTKEWGWHIQDLVSDGQGDFKYAKSVIKAAYPIEDTEARVRILALSRRSMPQLTGYPGISMASVRESVANFLHNNYDRVLGYDLSSYVDKKRNIMLAFSKDGISWQNKVQIAATDPSAGEFPNTLTRGDGVTTLIWQKFGNNRATTLGTGNFVLPTGGIGAAGHGIWQTPVNYIHDADTGPIFFQSKDNNATTREESLIVAGGKNPVIVADGGLGVDNLFYWSPARYCTGGTGGQTLQCYAYRETGTVPVTLGAVCVTISKDGETWSDKPVLLLPTPVDDSTKIPQQTVGVSIKGSGNFLISWVDKDGEAHQDVINLLEKNAVSK